MVNSCFERASAFVLVGLCLSLGTQTVYAQSSPGQDWSAGWSFQTATDRSVALSRATTIRQMQGAQGPTTVVNTNNYYNTDNRANYVEVVSDGAVSTDYQIGDDIGQNTNSVGSMNTGNTTIDIQGDSNAIHAINSADNTGCVDGSALTSTMTSPATSGSLGIGASAGSLGLGTMVGGGLASAGDMGMGAFQFGNIASPVQDCIK